MSASLVTVVVFIVSAASYYVQTSVEKSVTASSQTQLAAIVAQQQTMAVQQQTQLAAIVAQQQSMAAQQQAMAVQQQAQLAAMAAQQQAQLAQLADRLEDTTKFTQNSQQIIEVLALVVVVATLFFAVIKKTE